MEYDQHADVPIPAQKTFYIANCDGGERLPVQYNPNNYSTCEAAAKAFYEALKPVVRAYGQDPDSELSLFSPERTVQYCGSNEWCVVWEAGPYQWAVGASIEFMYNRKAGWFTEPYYSFDLCFTE